MAPLRMLRQCIRRLIEQQVDAPGDEILHRRRESRDRARSANARRFAAEQETRHIVGAAGGAEQRGIGLQPRDQFLEITGRHVFPGDEHSGVAVSQIDRVEIFCTS